MKLCTKCVTPETAESIKFDNNGSCSVCAQINFKNEKVDWTSRSREFDLILQKHKNKYDYDCIIPFSGGKDSTFTLWYIVTQKKLKPLVVRFDHGFYRNNLQENTERTIKKLGVDFINFRPNSRLVKLIMLESLIRRGDFCWHCHVGISAYPIKVAIEKKIPLLILGEPSAEYGSFYNYNEIELINVEKFNKMANLGINAEDMYGMIKDRFKDQEIDIRDFEPFKFPTQGELNKNNILGIYLGSYIPWDVKKQVEIIKKELKWQGDDVEGIPPEYNYEKIECYMQGLRDYLKFIKRGFGRTSHLTSIDIRNGRMTREEAVKLIKAYDGKKPKALDFFLKMTQITEDEFYDYAFNHIVEPNKEVSRDFLKKNISNKVPDDFQEIEKNL
jgi:N-acetyl sugar amidotransferase